MKVKICLNDPIVVYDILDNVIATVVDSNEQLYYIKRKGEKIIYPLRNVTKIVETEDNNEPKS